jgi:hypothetical protein
LVRHATRQIERGGQTRAAAERATLAALRDRARLPNKELTPETRLSRVNDDWGAELDERDLPERGRITCRRQLQHIREAKGALQLREASVRAVVTGSSRRCERYWSSSLLIQY